MKSPKPIILRLLLLFFCGCGTFVGNPPPDDDGDSPASMIACEGHAVPLPEPPPSGSQLTFQVGEDIDPCSVSGFVVGLQEELKVQASDDGSYFINNMPPGKHDIVVTALAKESGAALSERSKGVRLGTSEFLAGLRKEIGKLELPTVGSISGTVTLAGKTDHAGIHVYIPGTGYDATTDKGGKFSISPFVPVGVNNLFYEKDGYHRGQVESIKVEEEKVSTTPTIELVPSTGAEGFLTIENGTEIFDSWIVSLNIGATEDASLMKISESDTFGNSSWQPIISSTTYEFDSDGKKTLYIKFADANGLESSPFDDSIIVDTFGPEVSVTIDSGFTGFGNATLNFDDGDDPAGTKKIYISSVPEMTDAEVIEFVDSISRAFDYSEYYVFEDGLGRKSEPTQLDLSYVPELPDSKFGAGYARHGNLAIFSPRSGDDQTSVAFLDTTKMSWFTSELSESRQNPPVAAAGNVIMFGPSWSDTSQLDTGDGVTTNVDIYNIDSDTWTTSALSVNRAYMAAASVNTKILFAGGSNSGVSDVVDIYEVNSKTWSTANLSVARSEIKAATVGNKVIFAGGGSDAIDIYDDSDASWSSASLATSRTVLCSTSNAKYGVFAAGESISDVDVFKADTETWHTYHLPQVRRSGLMCAIIDNTAYFIGGRLAEALSSVTTRIDILDLTSGQWTSDELYTGVSNGNAIVANGKIYLIGIYNEDIFGTSVITYDPKTEESSNIMP